MSAPIRTEFLVYGECECGWYCACPEGWNWPKCPGCDEQVMPQRRRDMTKTLGYVAELRPEQEAFRDPRVEPYTGNGYPRHHDMNGEQWTDHSPFGFPPMFRTERAA